MARSSASSRRSPEAPPSVSQPTLEMPITAASWRLAATVYRALVAAQTLAWAALSFAKVLSPTRRVRLADGHVVGLAVLVLCVTGLAAGILTVARRRGALGPVTKERIILTWIWFQLSGVLALFGYFASGDMPCFLAGVAALGLMHCVSPNRFR